MLNLIIELSKYFLLILIVLYTFEALPYLSMRMIMTKRYILRKQLLIIVFLDFTAFLVIFLKTEKVEIIYLFGGVAAIPDYCAGIVSHFL